MQTVSPNKAGIALGVLLGAWHAMWAIFVAVGWAQPIVDFVFWMHMIKSVLLIAPFNIGTALLLVAVTGALGYIAGFILAALWNWLLREAHHVAPQPQQRAKLTPAAR